MRRALAIHDALIADTVGTFEGVPVKERGEGDSWFVVFASAPGAVAAAAEMQRRIATTEWDTEEPIRVRVSLHTGEAGQRDGDYYGPTVNRAARLRGIAHGGQTVLSRSTFELVRDAMPEGVTATDMGEHRLKDLTRPEHVYQLDIAGLENDFPPLRSLDSVANNLPVQLTEFVGRVQERREVAERLKETRMLTILAAGGSGKTRLGIQVAADLSDDYPDGVFFIPLADTTSEDDIVQTITESLGIGLSADEDRRGQLLGYLAGKRQLLVFDNFEHLGHEAPIVSDILQTAPAINVLATSRTKLRIAGESIYNLDGLDIVGNDPTDALDTEAAALFVEAARRVDASFAITEEDADAIGDIIRSTAGLPLGIELAAAWVDMLSVPEIASEISKSLDFLETDAGGVPDRHRSIRAVFDYSWELLSEDERTAFTALSVFRGGFTRDAAEKVAGASLRGLANLSNKSLLLADPTVGRYQVHELLRQYAEAELASDRDRCDEVKLAHAGYFADVMDDMSFLFQKADQRLLAATIEADLDNIRAAWRYFLDTRDATNALRFIVMLYVSYELRGWYPAAVELFDEAREPFEGYTEPDRVAVYQTARAARAWAQVLMGQVLEGSREADAALAALPETTPAGARWLVVQAAAIGNAYLGKAEEMTAALELHYPLYAEMEQKIWASGIRNWLSFSYILRGDFATASEILSGVMEFYEEIDDHYFMTWASWLLAMVASYSGDHETAITHYTKQGDRSREIGYLRGQVESYSGVGYASAAIERYDDAERALIESLRISERMGMLVDMVALLARIAQARAAQGETSEAVALLTHVIDHPLSERQPLSVNVPIREMAEASLASVQEQLDPGAFEAAVEEGHGLDFDSVVNSILGRA